MEQSPSSIIITDLRGEIHYVNPQFTKTTGYSLQEVLGKNPRLLKSNQMPSAHYTRLWATILQGKVWRGELHNRKKNGELFWESASVSPISDGAGKISHFVAVKEDITQRRHLEAQLRQAQKLEAIGQLAGGVAHDFNNILAAIMMHIGLLQMNPKLDEVTRQALKDLIIEARRAANLTRQLLMFSRRSVLTVKALDLNEVVANLLKMLSRLIGEHIDLRFEGEPALPTIEADAGMMERVLMNLVVNARDAMHKGGQITIRTALIKVDEAHAAAHPDRCAGRFISLTVSDTGCGMDTATLKRVFEPFFTTKPVGFGTGLGLATAHGIVAQHKGWVEVESAPGMGASFQVFLPAAVDLRTKEEQCDRKGGAVRGGSEAVLVVEDDLAVRQMVCQALRKLGYAVTRSRERAAGAETLADARGECGTSFSRTWSCLRA